jgi:hypothetical protein
MFSGRLAGFDFLSIGQILAKAMIYHAKNMIKQVIFNGGWPGSARSGPENPCTLSTHVRTVNVWCKKPFSFWDYLIH